MRAGDSTGGKQVTAPDKHMPSGRNEWELQGPGRMTVKQQKMLNAVCGCLEQIHWHGDKLHKDDWRHLLSAVSAGQVMLPGWHYGDGRPQGFIMLGKSSLSMTRSEASDAITMGVQLGDNPDSQGIKVAPVMWTDAVILGLGFNPADLRMGE